MIDYDDPMWTEIVQKITVRESELKDSLCARLSMDETSLIRGKIGALREVLEWPKTDPARAGRPTPEVNFGV